MTMKSPKTNESAVACSDLFGGMASIRLEGWADKHDLQEYVGGHEVYLHRYQGRPWEKRQRCRVTIEFLAYTVEQQKRLRRLAKLLLRDCVISFARKDGERLNALGCCVQIECPRHEGIIITVMDKVENKPYGVERFKADCVRAGVLPNDRDQARTK